MSEKLSANRHLIWLIHLSGSHSADRHLTDAGRESFDRQSIGRFVAKSCSVDQMSVGEMIFGQKTRNQISLSKFLKYESKMGPVCLRAPRFNTKNVSPNEFFPSIRGTSSQEY
jgi:hypothetical protein